MINREKIIQNHSYSIWEGKDSKWRTYIYDATKSNNRRLIKRNSFDEIGDFLVKNYKLKNAKKDTTARTVTLRSLYPEWIRYKLLHVNSPNTIVRIQNDWNRYYADTEIVDIPIKNLTYLILDNWTHTMVKFGNAIPSKSNRHKKKVMLPNMSQKQFGRISIIMRQGLNYAVKKGLIKKNPFLEIEIDRNLFRKDKKKKDDTQVYLINEEKKMLHFAWENFYKNPSDLSSLAILLNFYVGARIGELVAFRREDLENNYLHVQRMEVKEFDLTDILNPVFVGYKVVPYTKSNAGDRLIYLTSEAREIFELILKTLDKYHSDCKAYYEGYLFIKNRKRITHTCIEHLLRKNCLQLDMMVKSNHKIRKTYISTLIDSGLNINAVREFAGHEDERTTLNNYTFNRLGDSKTEDLLENVLSKKNNSCSDIPPDSHTRTTFTKNSIKVIKGNQNIHSI